MSARLATLIQQRCADRELHMAVRSGNVSGRAIRPSFAAANAGAVPPMDEIRRQCALLLSDDTAIQTAAFDWLRECKPFRRLLVRFREHDLTLFDLAAALKLGATRPLSGLALQILAEELTKANPG